MKNSDDLSRQQTNSNKQLTIAMIISMALWGMGWPSAGVLTKLGDPLELGIYRYGLVVLSFTIMVFFMKVPLKIAKKGIPFLIIAGVLMAVYNYTFLKGLQFGSPGAGGILVTTLNPIVAYGVGILVSWKRPTRNETIGLLLGVIAGLVLLEVWANGEALLSSGNLLFLLCALVWAIMSKFTSQSARYGSPFAFFWWQYLITLICFLPIMDVAEVSRLAHLTGWKFWGNLLFGSVIVTSVATTVYFYATSKIGAEKASSFIFTVPVTAAIASWLAVGESIQPHTMIGGAIGIAAVYMINKKQTVKEPVPAEQ